MKSIDFLKEPYGKKLAVAIFMAAAMVLLMFGRILMPAYKTINEASALQEVVNGYDGFHVAGKRLDSTAHYLFDGSDDELQLHIFQHAARYTDSLGVRLEKFGKISENPMTDFLIVTSTAEFHGNYKNLLSLIFTLERDLEKVRIVNVSFAASIDRRLKKRALSVKIIFQAILKQEDETPKKR